MSKRKGLSVDEKRNRLLELFHERKEFFNLKELEKIAPKEKGIVSQSVKEVLQSLVDDNLVETDKIGISVYFWAYPSKARSEKKAKLETTLTNLEKIKIQLAIAKEKLAEKEENNKDLPERDAALQKLNKLKIELDNLKKENARYSHCGPQYLKTLQQDNIKIKEAINRWTENIFAVKSWCKGKTSMEEEMLNIHFGIPIDLDYI